MSKRKENRYDVAERRSNISAKCARRLGGRVRHFKVRDLRKLDRDLQRP